MVAARLAAHKHVVGERRCAAGVEYNCNGYQDTEVQGFQAPNQVGTYVFRFNRDYKVDECNPNKELDSPIFAAFCVK